MIVIYCLISLVGLACLVAVIKPFGPFVTRGKAFVCLLGLLCLNGIITTAASQNQSKADAKVEPKPALAVPEASSVETPSRLWTYTTYTDEMTSVESKIACTKSLNELTFDFPYSGGSSGRLCFRRKGKSLDAWVDISPGQFLCGIERCSLKLRFDEGSVQTFHAIESSTHASNKLFIEPASRLFTAVKKAKQVKLQAEYYQEGSQVLTFTLDNLDASKL